MKRNLSKDVNLKWKILLLMVLFVKMPPMKTIEVLGIKIKDYTLKEALEAGRSCMQEPGLYTMYYVSKRLLLSVCEDAEQKRWFEDIDLVLCAEDGILTESDEFFDGKRDDFFEIFMRNLASAGTSVFIVTDADGDAEKIKETMLRVDERLNFVGQYVYKGENDKERMFNEINTMVPGVIVSNMEWYKQGKLMYEGKRFLNASVWLGLPVELPKDVRFGKKFLPTGWMDGLRFRKMKKEFQKINK